MTNAGILYTAELDLAEADIEPFNRWYAGRHVPDLYQVGFQVCTCYRAIEGDMNLLDLYEAASWEIFNSPEYRGMGARDPYGAELMTKRRNKAHTVYAQRLITPHASGKAALLNADWVSLVRFDAAGPTEQQVADFVTTTEAARLIGLGARRVRLAHRTTDHPTYPTFRPRSMLLIEWPQRPATEAAPARHLQDRFPGALSHVDSFIGYRLYPWPDRKGTGP
jgi:hypothetical protein